jgi:hypothetical protein
VLALLREDVIRERPEPPEVTERQRAAFAELLADPHHLLLVGELEAGLVATAQASWLRYSCTRGPGLPPRIGSRRAFASGRGLGQRLVATIIELASIAGAHGCS